MLKVELMLTVHSGVGVADLSGCLDGVGTPLCWCG